MRSFPVLLVAGIAGGNAPLGPLVARLRKTGFTASCVFAPPVRSGLLGPPVRRLRREIMAYPGPMPLVLLGYSMGGLIAVSALEEAAAASRVRRVVTFGAPFDGALGWPGNKKLERVRAVLNARDRRWSFAAANGRRDVLAPFPQSAVPAREGYGGDYGHHSILDDSELLDLLVRLIAGGG